MDESRLDLSRVLTLEPHGPDTYVGESPAYAWGRIYGGLVIAQALRAATYSVRAEHNVHSLHAYFILGGDPSEPVRYEVDRLRDGRSFTTRQVVARQSGGAILNLSCSFQVRESGPETQSASFPDALPVPGDLPGQWFAGVERRNVPVPPSPPRSLLWTRFPLDLAADPVISTCALAYLSDLNPMSAIIGGHPRSRPGDEDDDGEAATFMTASLDHAMWFHRPVQADQWVLLDMTSHGVLGTRGLATGLVFNADGGHVATVAQEGLLRVRTTKN